MKRQRLYKRILIMFLALILMIVMMPITAFAIEDSDYLETTYQIGTAEELLEFAAIVNEGNTEASAVLTANIDLSGVTWTGISVNTFYTGVFDGQGYSIMNLNGSEGLFKYSKGIVKNVQLVDVAIQSSGGNLGAIVGKNEGTVFNCASSGTVSGDSYSVGGIVGWNHGGTIAGCLSSCSVSGYTAGGLLGSSSGGGSVTACVYMGDCANPIEGDIKYAQKKDVFYRLSDGSWKNHKNQAVDAQSVFSIVNAYIRENGGYIFFGPNGAGALTYYDYDEDTNSLVWNYLEDSYTKLTAEYLAQQNNILVEGWYLVTGALSTNSRIVVSGDVHLVLADGADFKANAGIDVSKNNRFTIYAQSVEEENMGKLYASGTDLAAGIGSDSGRTAGMITINGGIVQAQGGTSGAGIGGGKGTDGGTITINSGDIHANGGVLAVGIGGSNGTITINGGTVTANGGEGEASIGGDKATFTTDKNGTAAIFASSISDQTDKANWRGLIFEGNEGKIYGTSYTVNKEFTIPEMKILTIEEGKVLIVNDDITFTNLGGIRVNLGGTYYGKQPTSHSVIYQIGWDTDADGTIDDATYVAYGTTPTHEDGSKDADAQYTYAFKGWDPAFAAVSEPMIYTAQFIASLNHYDVIIPTGEGYTVNYSGSANVAYGDIFSFTVSIAEGYDDKNLVVKANGEKLITQSDGSYQVKVTGATEITIEGVNWDSVPPVISGVTQGGTYYVTQNVSVTDDHLLLVTLNNEPVTDETFSLEGNRSATYVIVAIDQAGNTTSCTVTMKPISTLAGPIEGITLNNVTSADKENIEAVKKEAKEVDTASATQTEKESLQEIIDRCDALLMRIEQASQVGNSEIIEKVEGITSDTVRPENKDDLILAKEELEDALDHYGNNYTKEEKDALLEKLEQINHALESLERVETVQNMIAALPETVEPDDTETEILIHAAKEQYDVLTDHEKSLVSQKSKEKLDSLLCDLLDYRIIAGNGSHWITGEDGSITMTANGPIEKFTRIEVDGNSVGTANYTIKSGSTIISLKSDYLHTLSVGKHTLTIFYTDGEVSGEFEIIKSQDTATLETGVSSNVVLWASCAVIATCALIATMVYIHKKKNSK